MRGSVAREVVECIVELYRHYKIKETFISKEEIISAAKKIILVLNSNEMKIKQALILTKTTVIIMMIIMMTMKMRRLSFGFARLLNKGVFVLKTT